MTNEYILISKLEDILNVEKEKINYNNWMYDSMLKKKIRIFNLVNTLAVDVEDNNIKYKNGSILSYFEVFLQNGCILSGNDREILMNFFGDCYEVCRNEHTAFLRFHYPTQFNSIKEIYWSKIPNGVLIK